MQKFLRTLALMAFLAVPWATQAQSVVNTFPFSCDFENASDAALWSFTNSTNGWAIGTAVNNGGTSALYISNDEGTTHGYNLNSAANSYAVATFQLSASADYELNFDMICVGEGTYDFLRVWLAPASATFTAGSYPTGGSGTSTPSGWIDLAGRQSAVSSWTAKNATFSVPEDGNYQLVFMWRNDGSMSNGVPAAIDNISITAHYCKAVTDLAVSDLAANTLTLSWSDATNTGATYNVYNGTALIASNLTATTYNVTGLSGNTDYEFTVRASCTNGEESAATSVSAHTACELISSLPYEDGMEAIPSGSYQMPYCWSKYNGGMGNYPYSYTSYAHTGSRALYFYVSTSSSYPDAEYAILPQVDVTAYPMNQNMVSFWLVASNLANFSVEVGTMSDPTDPTTFTSLQVLEAPASTYTSTPYLVKLTNAPATDAYVAIRANKASGYFSAYIDDIVLDQMPSCWPVTDLAVDATTSNSVTLSWNDVENTDGITYSVTYGDQTVSGLTSPATLTGLTANTAYTFNVVANCAANDASNAVSISTRTLCDQSTPLTLPFTMGFEENEEDIYCWSAIYADENPSVNTMGIIEESGSRMWRFSSYSNSSDYNQYLATPVFASTEPVKVKFSHKAYGTYNDQIRVLYTTTESGDELLEATDWMKSETLTTDSVYLPATANRVIFHYYGSYLYYYYIDNIVVDVAPTHTVSFNYLTTDDGVTVGSAAAANAATYEADSVLLTSTPATNMRTAAWYLGEYASLDDLEGVAPYAIDTDMVKIQVMNDMVVTVVYGYGQFEIKGITANANQARMGSVAGDSPYNNNMYDYGTTATLTATANTGFQFIEWRNEDGTVFSTDNPLVIDEVLQPYSLIGHFGIASYEVAAETEHGHVEGLGTYTFGSSVTLTAVADPHYHFVKWADDDMTNAERAYRVIADATFHPVFEPDVYSVTVNGPAVATYTVKDAEGNETNSFAYTTEATVNAADIDEHYTFVSWNVISNYNKTIYFYSNDDFATIYGYDDENNTYLYNGETFVPEANVDAPQGDVYETEWSFSENVVLSTTNPYTFSVENDIVLTPVYDAEQMTLTIASNDVDMGSVSFADYEGTSVTVDFMTQVLVHAEAVPGGYSNFTGWYNGTELVSTSADYWVTVEQPMTLTANFSFTEYPVFASVDPIEWNPGTVNITPLPPYQFSDNVTFTATANDHWVFSHWTYADQTAWLSQNAEYSEMVFEALNLVAHFVRDNHTIVATVADASHGTTVVTDENGAEATEPFIHGSYATVSFTEDYGYSFAGWKNQHDEIVSMDNTFTFEVTEDTVLTATVSPLPYTVYIDVNPDEDGYIRGGAWVSEDDASFAYDYLTQINAQLTTEPVYGYVFDRWTNDADETVELPFTLTEDTYLFANFKKDQFTVTGTVDQDYRMMGRVSGTETVDYLEYVTLTASENNGYTFVKWVDAEGNDLDLTATYEEPTTLDEHPIYTNVSGTSISVLASADVTLKAVYDYEYYSVEALTNDENMGTVAINDQPLNPVDLAYSQTVTLKADAKEHYHFVQWQDENTDNPRSFILTEPVSFTATFAIDTHTVTLVYKDAEVESIALVPTDGTIALSATNTYDYNTELQATIAPKHGYVFAGWSFDGTTVADPSDDFIFTLTQDTTLTALFERDQYTVTVASADATMGSAAIEGEATVAYEGTVTIKATPEYGYDFVNWTNDLNEEVLTDATAQVTVLDHITYTANFQVHQYTMTALVNDEVMGGVGIGLLDPNAQPINAEATVADGTNTNKYIPVYGSYADAFLRSQVVYPAATMAEAGVVNGSTISKMTFYSTQSSVTAIDGNWQVNLKESASTSLSSFESGATNVYEGTVNVTNSQMVINFATPYTYNGGNLLVEFIQDEVSSSYPSTTFYGQGVTGASVQGYDYGSVDDISASQRNFLPKTTFGYSYVPGPEVNNFTSEATAQGAYNTAASFEAQANYGYHFVDWTNSADEHLTENPQEVTILRDSTLTANFAKNTYHIVANTQLNHGATGTVAITGTTEDNIDVEYLDEVTLTATVAEPYRLLRWEDQNGTSLGNTNPLTISATTDSNITAVFDYEVYTLTANTEDINKGGVYVNDPNASGVVAIAEGFESGLNGWTMSNTHSGTGVNYGNAFEGSSAFRFYYSTNPPQYLISPEMTTSNPLAVSFQYRAKSTSYTESFQVGYSTTDKNVASFTWGDEVTTNSTTYAEYATTAPAGTKYVAIKYTADDQYYLFVDDININSVASGETPSLTTSNAVVDYNTDVPIVATPAEHYHFDGWYGEDDALVSAHENETITVDGDITLTAKFQGDDMPMTYQVNNAVRGTVEGPATAEYNTEVEISAIAAHGYEFTGWDDDATAEATRTVTVKGTDAENTYKANFGFQTYDFNVTVENGTVSVTNEVEDVDGRIPEDVTEISNKYYYGSEVELTFTANEHYHFVVNDANVTTYTQTVTFLEAPEAINVEAVIDQHNVTLVANDATLGTIEGAESGVYDYGTELTFTATPAEHQHFVNWSDGEESAERTITVEGDLTLTANFQVNMYAVAAEADAEQGTATVTVSDAEVTTVLPNTDVTFTATPNPGYEFANWTMGGEEVSTESPYTMAITENTTLTANFNFVGFAITVASNNDVMGTAYINDDAEQTSIVAAYEEDVVLNAVPEYGYIFENWTLNGAEVSTEATATVQATTAADYIANFNFDNFDLNVAVAEGQEERGTVTGAGNYPYGTQVEIAAVANDGYLFTNWNDGVTTATRTVTVDGATEYVASFRTDATYTVTVIAENGTVSGTGSNFIENDLVSLNAVPATGYRFVSYTDAEGTVLSDNAAYSFNITSDVTLTANFAALPYNVVLNADATMGSVTGAGEYTYGSQATIEAVANEGYYFTQWSDNVTTNPRTIVVIEDVELTAQFEAIPAAQYYIGAVAVNGTVEGAGTYEDGTQVTLTATANNCYQFTGWMVDNQTVSTANPYVFTATENVTVMATFEAISLSGEETQVACESYTWNGQTYTASGDYTASLTSNGCDSVATLHLTINTPVNTTEDVVECQSYTWNVNNQTYTTSGTYTASIEDANGCTATATLNLTINGAYDELITASSCGDYEWNGITYDEEGVYTQSFTAANGCDSVVTLILTVNEAVDGGDSIAVACGSFEWNGEYYTQSGDYTLNLMAANGCDSTVTLHLTINQAVDVTVFDTACDTYTWNANNVEYTSTGTYLHTFEQGTVTGCDSTVTLYLTINSSVNTTIEATATGSYEWNGNVYTESGEYTFNGQTVNGCDSIVTLLLTIEAQNYTVTVNVNNSAMGTVNPAGEITVAAGESFTATAEANEGFRFIGWSNGATTETVTIVVESDTTLTANFEAITYTINATANDETMGYVTGSGEYSYGAVVTLEAVANNGYHFVRWSDGTTNAHYEFNATADVTITAYFEADQTGIEDVDGADVNIYSADSKIIVKGAENLDIYVYDVNGRVVRTQAAAAETVEFTMNTTGVYLVKVGSAPAKRVVVVR